MSKPSVAERRARWAVATVFLANGALMGTWAAHIPLVEQRLAISHSTLGIALLAMALGALVAMPIGGAAIARFGSAAVTRASTLAWVASFPLPVLAPDPALLIAALLLFGAANGVMDVAMNAHGVTVEGRLGRPIMSSLHGMWSLGGLAGAGAAAVLLPFLPALGQALIATLTVAVAGGAALLFLLPSHEDSNQAGSSFALPDRATLGLGILCFLVMTSEGAVLDWSALHLRTSLEVGAGIAATGFAAYSATMAGGRFIGDWLRGHVGPVALVRASALLAALGLAAALVVPSPAVAVAGFAVVGLGLSNLVPTFFSAAGQMPGKSAGTAIAAVATMGYSGFLAGPPLIGFAAELTSLAMALGLVVVACLFVAVCAFAVGTSDRRPALAAG
jgi:MFS family permease